MNSLDEKIVDNNDNPIKYDETEPFINEYENIPLIKIINEILMFPELLQNKYFIKCLHDIIDKHI
jgi:hypothetical protein